MIILVCGGREFDDWELLSSTLEPYLWEGKGWPFWITGGAKGADFLTRVWVKTQFIGNAWKKYYREFPADWKQFGNHAGPIRNQQMLDEGKPDLVIAFPGGVGTADMVSRAKKAGIEVREISN